MFTMFVPIGDIALYVWLGTCNLTSKDKSRFISLSSQNSETIDHILYLR
jgi:hypothetical protein